MCIAQRRALRRRPRTSGHRIRLAWPTHSRIPAWRCSLLAAGGRARSSSGSRAARLRSVLQVPRGGYRTAAVRDRTTGVAPFDGSVEAVSSGELLEPAAFGRMAGDAVEERGEKLRPAQAH